MAKQLIECVPNFSEGRDTAKIDAIVASILSVPEVALLDREAETLQRQITETGAPCWQPDPPSTGACQVQ